ncbi:retrovirus-related pol polyprotein from transposon TNT 1-94, partial [Tanacetum coccineum]
MEWCHKLLTDQVDDTILKYNVSKPLLLGGKPGHITIQPDFFFNKDLKYLRYGHKDGRPALSISKMKAAYYPDVGLEETGLITSQMRGNEDSPNGQSFLEEIYGVQMDHKFNEIYKFSVALMQQIDEALWTYRVKESGSTGLNPGDERQILDEKVLTDARNFITYNVIRKVLTMGDGNPSRANIKQALAFPIQRTSMYVDLMAYTSDDLILIWKSCQGDSSLTKMEEEATSFRDDDEDDGASRASTASPTTYLNSLQPLNYQRYDIPTSSQQDDDLLFERQTDLLNQTQQMHKELRDDTKTPSPKHQVPSPSAPNAPSKTPSTKDTSSSSIDYIPKSPTSSTSLSTNGYLNSPTSPPPSVPPPPLIQESGDITLALSPITPLDVYTQGLEYGEEICFGVDLEPDEWIKDSGCSKHMTGNLKLFSTYKAYNGGDVIFGSNLRGQICDNKCRVTFSKHDSEITKDGKVIGRGIRKKGLYVMKLGNKPKDQICLATIDENSTLWHRRLGYTNMRLIQSLDSKELGRNLPKLKFDQYFCDACKMGKQAHASHKAKNIVSTTRCLELLHMDLFYPSAVRSYRGNRYTLVIVDDYS